MYGGGGYKVGDRFFILGISGEVLDGFLKILFIIFIKELVFEGCYRRY